MDAREPDAAYRGRRLEERIAADERTAELGLRVTVRGDRAYLRGEVATDERRRLVEQVVHEVAPDLTVVNDLSVTDMAEHDEPSEETLT